MKVLRVIGILASLVGVFATSTVELVAESRY